MGMGKEKKILVMENNIFVTIAIPLYNKEQYIERCFNSVAKQTYKNIECIIVEDCSTDNSMRIAEQLIANYIGPIKFLLIKHEQNEGLSVSRNTGIFNSKGDYIFFLDADDEITEICISSLVALAEKYPGVDMVQGGILLCKDKDEIFHPKEKLPEIIKGNMEIRKKYQSHNHIPVSTWNKLVRKEFIRNNNLYFKKGLVHEDLHWKHFWLKSIECFAFTTNVTYIYYVVSDSIMTNTNLFQSISTHLTIAEDILNNLDLNFLEQEINEARWILLWQKERILSDEKYSLLLNKCNKLLNKLPKSHCYILLAIREISRELKRIIKVVIYKILGKNIVLKIKVIINNVK